MNKITTESPNGLTVSIAHYNSLTEAYELETQDPRGHGWSMWFDSRDDLIFLSDVLNDYIEERNLREKAQAPK